jgi:membrane protease YdiL (CAAX protease family)
MRLTGRYRDHPGHFWPRRPWFARDPYDYTRTGYLAGTRHPWPCLLFISLLLGLYEFGVSRLQGENGESLRAGVELWLWKGLDQAGPVPPIVIPATVVGLLLLATLWRWSDRPRHLVATVFGMAVEGVAFGLGLWALCLNAPQLLDQMGLPPMAVGGPDPKLVTYLGVGIYEEVIFRLIAFAWLARILRIAFVPYIAAVPIAIVASSALFALAHHFVQTDPFVPAVFVTRMLVGAYCAVLYWTRGLGVAIGAHVVYDIVVGVPQG